MAKSIPLKGDPGDPGDPGKKGDPGEPGPRGFPGRDLPDVPQSWDRFLTKLAAWTASIIAFGTLVLTQVQSCQTRQVQVRHGEQIQENKEGIEKHAEKIDEIKAALPDK